MRRIKVNGSNFLNSTYFHSRGVGPIFLYNVNPMCVIAGMELGIGLVGWGERGDIITHIIEKLNMFLDILH